MQGLEKLVNEVMKPVEVIDIQRANDQQVAVVHDGYSLHDLEQFLDRPRRLKAAERLHTVESFCRYLTRFKTEATVVIADVADTVFRATIDYHEPGNKASHCDHMARYTCPLSDEWTLWTENDGKKFTQADFARFLEENLIDIVTPDGASMYEVTRTLEAKTKVEFKSGVRLENGSVQLQFNEETEAKGKGNLEIPATFKLGIPVFLDGDGYELDAFLRYRISGEGGLTFHYDLHRPHRVLADAFGRVAETIKIETEIEPLFGSV